MSLWIIEKLENTFSVFLKPDYFGGHIIYVTNIEDHFFFMKYIQLLLKLQTIINAMNVIGICIELWDVKFKRL